MCRIYGFGSKSQALKHKRIVEYLQGKEVIVKSEHSCSFATKFLFQQPKMIEIVQIHVGHLN